MQPRPAGKPGGFVNVTTNYSLGAVSVTTNNANLKSIQCSMNLIGTIFKTRKMLLSKEKNISKLIISQNC